jgi:hypothetical protein
MKKAMSLISIKVSSGNQLQLIAQQCAGTGICSSSGNSFAKMKKAMSLLPVGEVSSGNQLTCQLMAQQSAGTGICSSSGNSLAQVGEGSSGSQLTCQLLVQQSAGTGICSS